MKKIIFFVAILTISFGTMSFIRSQDETTTILVAEQSFVVPTAELYQGLELGQTFELPDLSNLGVATEGTTTIVCPGDEVKCIITLYNSNIHKAQEYDAKKYRGVGDIVKTKNGTKMDKLIIDL